MTEIFTFAPTDRELETAKQARQTAKQLLKEFQKQYKIALHATMLGKQTTGGHLVNFKKAAGVCALYNQPVPDDLQVVIKAYERAEAEHVKQARWEEENPLVRYPRPYRKTVLVWQESKKKAKQPTLFEESI